MKSFKIDKNAEVICDYHNTRNGFKHTATLLVNGQERESAKVCYLNRTWESFEFETVMRKLFEKTNYLTKTRTKNFFIKASGRELDRVKSEFKTIGAIAKLGDLFCEKQEDKNDWKKRMLKAGLENKGLIMPDDWDNLSEEEKEIRLNKVIQNFN